MKNLGFIPPKNERIQNEGHYILGQGKLPLVIIKPDGNWGNSLLKEEFQSNLYIETCNCTGFNSVKQIEEYMLATFGKNVNYSARWVGIIAGTQPPGNDPHTVYEAIRKYGLIPEEMLPFDETIKTVSDYYSFKGADKDACYKAGKQWLEEYNFGHEWVFDPGSPLTREQKVYAMKIALTASPLGIAVYAWYKDNRGIYTRLADDCHWTSQYAFKQYQKIFDSYMPSEKDVDQEVFYAKRIHIEKNPTPVVSKSYFVELINKLLVALKIHGFIKSS